MKGTQVLLALLAQLALCLAGSTHPRIRFPSKPSTEHEDASYWLQMAAEEIQRAEEVSRNVITNKAKNVILFIGDGMSLPTVTASRIYKTQFLARQQGQEFNGEEGKLTFESLPHVGLSKTYCVDSQTPDSASTASAMYTGVKTNFYTMGFDNSIVMGSPKSELEATRLKTMMTWAQEAGKDTGLVTTTRVSHATPAALYAHTADRDWECDSVMPEDATEENHDITWQLVNSDPGRRAKVVFGGGRSSFLPLDPTSQTSRWNYTDDTWNCRRKDQRELIKDFLSKSEMGVPGFEGTKGYLVENRGELRKLDVDKADYVLGLFSWNHMKYDYQRMEAALGDEDEGEPSLAEMTEAAIKILRKNKEGFFLMVEGGKIDKAHHSGEANTALHETMALDFAVEKALELTDPKDTLIIVTADHGHTMTMAGYQTRGRDIRSFVDRYPADDNLPHHILTYANGPGYKEHMSAVDSTVKRADLSRMNFLDFNFHQPSTSPSQSETHSGSDVGIFASGPFAHFVHGVHQQNYIAYVMAYSSCVGPFADCSHIE